jgi:selenocysteine-specific elongation factor
MIRVVGTAGHVDHGKSALVQALTGIHPDRLKEEQERQMTIDLGFAWMDLPDGTTLGWVDVPGHRDFIENMLAGVTGIDAAVLVVAADEGVMPQTREHLAILDLLEVGRVLAVVTKVDLVEGEDWIHLVEGEVRQLLAPTRFADAPVVAVSSIRGTGLEQLTTALMALLKEVPPRSDQGRPRLPVDRAFTMQGFGTVVTGTLADGRLAAGDGVVVLPRGDSARVRGLQTHRKRVETALPGSRVAANLVGVEVGDVERGDVVCRPGTYSAGSLLDVQMRILADAATDVRHQQEVKLHIGAAERMAIVRFLDGEGLKRGQTGPAQLVLERPVVAARGDRFIVRRPTPGATLGGGVVLDASPSRRYRRHDAAAARRLQTLQRGTASDVIVEEAGRGAPTTLKDLARVAGLEESAAGRAVEDLVAQGRLVEIGGSGPKLWLERSRFEGLTSDWLADLKDYHAAYPLRGGMPREELRSRRSLDPGQFGSLIAELARRGLVREAGARLALPDHTPAPGAGERQRLNQLLTRFAAQPASPPSSQECREDLGAELFAFALEAGILTQVSEDVVFREADYQEFVARITSLLGQGPATVSQVRDLLGSSRKYVLALLEHLDRRGLTVREGDERRLARPSASDAAS